MVASRVEPTRSAPPPPNGSIPSVPLSKTLATTSTAPLPKTPVTTSTLRTPVPMAPSSLPARVDSPAARIELDPPGSKTQFSHSFNVGFKKSGFKIGLTF